MTENEAVSLAERAAKDSGRDLSSFGRPAISRGRSKLAFVLRAEAAGAVGGHFSVVVDEESGEARLIPGR